MKVLVTGGAGFIGSNIIRLLLQEGHEVTVLDNLLSGYRNNLDPFPEVRFVEGDVRDGEALARCASGIEAIFHLAASVGNTRSIEHPIEDSQINVIGTLNVLEAARHAGARKVVFSSSAGIFGELKTLPIREDHPVEPDSPYGASKLGAEKLCLAYAKLYELEAVCLRYFNVYGVNQRYDAYGNVIPIFAHRMLHGLPITIFGDGEQTRDFVNVRDVAQANYKAALSRGVSGAFNLGSATRVTINHLVELMAQASGIKPTVEHGSPRPGDVRDSLADISAAKAAIGFEPSVQLEEGLSEYMAWAEESDGLTFMRVLILGGAGMLGHKLWQVYRNQYDVWLTMRSGYQDYSAYGLFDRERVLGGVDAFDFDGIVRTVAQIKPDAVINCIGIIKQLKTAQDPIISLSINALFPHRLANLCQAAGARLIHISTDCVFSGRRGMYTEDDVSDAEDLYGRSKYLGETNALGCLTLRTSIIGRELKTTSGLVEWFLSHRGGQVQGYRQAIYSGFTTLALSRIITDVLENHTELSGVYQASSEPINKYELLQLMNAAFDTKVEIEENNTVLIDRSLDSGRFRAATGFVPPSWPEMIRELAADPTPYNQWRS